MKGYILNVWSDWSMGLCFKSWGSSKEKTMFGPTVCLHLIELESIWDTASVLLQLPDKNKKNKQNKLKQKLVCFSDSTMEIHICFFLFKNIYIRVYTLYLHLSFTLNFRSFIFLPSHVIILYSLSSILKNY